MTNAEIISIAAVSVSALSVLLTFVNTMKIEVVHKATNSMKDELVASVKEAALAKGKEDERLNQKDKETP